MQTTPHIKTGKLRALGVGASERSKVLPDVPPVAEAGVPGYEAVNWSGIVAPAGTPQPIIDKLHAALTAVAGFARGGEAVRQRRRRAVVQKSPTEFGAFMVSEMNKWEQRGEGGRHQGRIARHSGLPPTRPDGIPADMI